VPSINDVYNQLVTANGTLQQVHNDISALEVTANQIKTIDTNGFAKLVQLLQNLANLQRYTNQVLYHLSQQDDSIICILEHISQQTCALLNEAHLQTKLQTSIQKNVARLTDIAKTANPGAQLEAERFEALWRKVDECCPPEEPGPPCSYEKCPTPQPIKPPSGQSIPIE